MLEMTDVFKSFGDNKVLLGASVCADGETVALTGASGCGKTTVLRILAGLEFPDGGRVNVSGRTAVVFAEPRLFGGFSVTENVICVMNGSEPKTEKVRRAEEILCSLGLCGAGKLRPSELSSGMAERAALARAIAYDAENYILDEPFRALDEGTKGYVMKYVFDKLAGRSVIMVTHDETEAAFCKRTLVVENGKIKPAPSL